MHEAFKIDRDIPYPGPHISKGRPRTLPYPFRDLEVGDSFFVQTDETRITAKVHRSLLTAYNMARRDTGYNLVWAREPGGLRFFRIEGEAEFRTRRRPASGPVSHNDTSPE